MFIVRYLFALLLIPAYIFPLTAAESNAEFRATWVITWEWLNASNTVEQGKALTRTILDNHKKANMNAVLWQARQSGTVYFESSYEPWGSYVGGKRPGYDPLKYAIEEAHRRNMEFHAWFNVFHASSTAHGAPAAEHPEWVCRDQAGRAMTSSRSLSPGLEAVRDYTIRVAMELVRNYDIDGLHLDYVRWNEYSSTQLERGLDKAIPEERKLDGMITDEQLADLQMNQGSRYLYDVEHPYSAGVPEGFSSWEEWWRWSVTEFVSTLHDSIQAVKPWVRLSAAVLGKYNWSGWQGYGTVYQDAALWFNEGYVDQLTPMHYHWTDAAGFYDMLVGPNGDSNYAQCWGKYIQPGIQAGRLYTCGPGSYQFDDKNVWSNHVPVVLKVRTIPWVDGFQFFSYGTWKRRNYWSKAKSQFFTNLVKIRASGAIDSTAPEPPTITISKLDTTVYRLFITPAASGKPTARFIIYRQHEDSLIQPDTAPIVDIKFTDRDYIFTDHINERDGGYYYYGVTAVDRHWNESPVSNIVRTEIIPEKSIVPQGVTLTYVRSLGEGFELKWEPSGQADAQGYRIYAKSPESDWQLLMDESILGPDSTSAVVQPDGDAGGWLFTVRAVGLGPMKYESGDPDLYGASNASEQHVLVVDAFDRTSGQWKNSTHPFAGRISQALSRLSVSHDCCADEAFVDRTFDPRDYQVVIWLTGDETVANETLGINEMAFLANYLKYGGQLLMSGANVALDLDKSGTRQQQKFIHEYLHAKYINDGMIGNGYQVSGTPGSIFADLTFDFDDGTTGFDVAQPDVIDSTFGGQPCLTYLGGGTAGVQYQGTIDTGTDIARTIMLGFPCESIYTPAQTDSFMLRAMTFFRILGSTGVAESGTGTALSFRLGQNYPNPFNPETSIQYILDRTSHVSFIIYDVLGRQVRTLVNTRQTAGSHRVVWDGRSDYGETVRSGIYFYQIKADDRLSAMRKMVLIR